MLCEYTGVRCYLIPQRENVIPAIWPPHCMSELHFCLSLFLLLHSRIQLLACKSSYGLRGKRGEKQETCLRKLHSCLYLLPSPRCLLHNIHSTATTVYMPRGTVVGSYLIFACVLVVEVQENLIFFKAILSSSYLLRAAIKHTHTRTGLTKMHLKVCMSKHTYRHKT